MLGTGNTLENPHTDQRRGRMCTMFPPVLTPYLIGLVTAPLAGMVIKPLLRGTVKTTVALVLQVKKLAAEAGEEIQDLAAEASADMASQTAVSADMAAKVGQSRGTGSGVARRGPTA